MVGLLRCVAPLALVAALSATPAQARQSQDDCRCVDSTGDQIENCSCFRAPDMEGLLRSYGASVQRPTLGIAVDVGQSAVDDADGALVTDVLEDGPAAAAGLRKGDVITRIDEQSLSESISAGDEERFDLDQSAPVQRLLAIARRLQPGQEVAIEYLRDGRVETTTVEAEDLSNEWGRSDDGRGDFSVAMPRWDADRFRDQMRVLTEGARAFRRGGGDGDVHLQGPRPPPFVFSGGMDRDGLELVELNPGLGEYFGTEDGVLVADVERGTTLGLQAGDVVMRVGDREVTAPDQFRRILSSYGDEEDISFTIMRDGAETTVTGRIRY